MKEREQWGSKFGFLMASAGAAIGLGTIWRFPFVVGENGGATFVFVYLLFTVLLAIPLIVAETAIGRKGKKNAVDTYKSLVNNKKFGFIGWLNVLANFIILAFYSGVAGWALYYFFQSLTGKLSKVTDYEGFFGEFISNPVQPIVWLVLLMIVTSAIVAGGVQKGIERWNNILMPTLFILLIALVIRSLSLEGAGEGIEFFLKPDFTQLSPSLLLAALGQTFFTLCIGAGTYLTFGSYCKDETNIPMNAINVSVFTTLIAIMAGLIIFPAVFHYGLDPAGGPGLVFVTFPMIFANMPFGHLFSILFFFVVFLAALTSAISMLEVTGVFVSEKTGLSRKKSIWLTALVISLVGIPCILSFGPLAEFKIFGRTLFDSFDFFSSSILLPLAGLMTSIFVGWIWKTEEVKKEVEKNGVKFHFFKTWSFLIKYMIPIAVLIIFLQSIFKF